MVQRLRVNAQRKKSILGHQPEEPNSDEPNEPGEAEEPHHLLSPLPL